MHRIFKAIPDRLYRAFLDADAMARCLSPYGFPGKVHQLDAKVDGTYRMSFMNFGTGHSHSFGGTVQELTPGERIRIADHFDDPNLPGEMIKTISLRKVVCGTELTVLQEGIPAITPVEMGYLGWQQSLAQLQQLVEPQIADGQ